MPVYKKLYTGAGGTPSYATANITVHSGKQNCIAVPFISQGFINKFVLKQVTIGGQTSVAVTAELLDSAVPYAVGETNSGTAAADAVQLYRIIPQQTATAGNVASLTDIDTNGYAFINLDQGFTVGARFIYLLINPTSAGTDTTWSCMIVAHDAGSA